MIYIKRLEIEALDPLSHLLSRAYPGAGLSPSLYAQRLARRWDDPYMRFYGVFDSQDSDALIGAMRYHDFKMNFRGRFLEAGGIGSVAVALTRKKEKMAFHMLKHFLYHYKAAGYPMALLYPFDPGFYKRMGFGYGSPQYQLRLLPDQLPATGAKEGVCLLERRHQAALETFYLDRYRHLHGLLEKHTPDFDGLFDDEKLFLAGFFHAGHLEGYFSFRFASDPTNFLLNDMVIGHWLWTSPRAFLGLSTFIQAQKDQIRHVKIHTQAPNFQFALKNAKDVSHELLGGVWHSTAQVGTGIMYRILDVEALLKALIKQPLPQAPQNFTLSLALTDTFMPENQGHYTLEFSGPPLAPDLIAIKKQAVALDASLVLSLDISDFSSLVMGSVSLKTLVETGVAALTDTAYLKALDHFFSGDGPPQCYTAF